MSLVPAPHSDRTERDVGGSVGLKQKGSTAPVSNGDSRMLTTIANGSLQDENNEFVKSRVDDILLSDIGVNTLLTRLKQSIASCREFASFLKKRANIEEEHAQGLRKMCKLTLETPRRLEGRHGSFLQQFDEITAMHDRIADNEMAFSMALHQMHEDLMELSTNMDRQRKQLKMSGLSSEKKVHDSIQMLEKSKARYDQIGEEYERARTNDKHGRDFKIGRGFAKTGAQVEEDLRGRVTAADQEYASKVQIANAQRQELLEVLRPHSVKALKSLISECDSGLTFSMQKFATLSEKLLLDNGLSVNPIKGTGSSPNAQSMRDIVSMINNEADFNKFVLSMESKVPTPSKSAEIKYERHQALNPMSQHHNYEPPKTSSSIAPPKSQHGMSGVPLQREQSSGSVTQGMGYGAVITQPAILPTAQPGYKVHHQKAQPSYSDLPKLKPVFGVSLDRLLERDGSAVPIIVYQCIQAVDLYGLEVEGIYRIPGQRPHVERLKSTFDHDSTLVDFRRPEDFFQDINAVTSVLKTFFRELPDPLLTSELYEEFIIASRLEEEILRRDTLHGIINRLPDPNYATFRALTLHLNRVQQRQHINRMSGGNLAICFGPTLMGSANNHDITNTRWQVAVVETVLNHWDSIFDPDE